MKYFYRNQWVLSQEAFFRILLNVLFLSSCLRLRGVQVSEGRGGQAALASGTGLKHLHLWGLSVLGLFVCFTVLLTGSGKEGGA